MENLDLFKPIKGYENIYSVDFYGNVYSHVSEKILTPRKERYLRVTLHNNGSRYQASVHRLVAETFLPNLESKLQVNHIDGNRYNNYYKNLEWCTQSENMKHAYEIGLQKPSDKQKEATAKYCKDNYSKKVAMYDLKGNFIKEFNSTVEAVAETGITDVSGVARGKRKQAKGYKFKYI